MVPYGTIEKFETVKCAIGVPSCFKIARNFITSRVSLVSNQPGKIIKYAGRKGKIFNHKDTKTQSFTKEKI